MFQHEAGEGDDMEAGESAGVSLVVLDEPSAASGPGERPFHEYGTTSDHSSSATSEGYGFRACDIRLHQTEPEQKYINPLDATGRLVTAKRWAV